MRIPGYSDYIQAYDENRIIGIGKNPADMSPKEGNLPWYQGMKIAIFDVADVANPKVIYEADIGDRGTQSSAFDDDRALLFDRDRGLLVFPVQLAQLTPERKSSTTAPANVYGQTTFQGAYVYEVSMENGIVLKGRITHMDNEADLTSQNYPYHYRQLVKRCGFIGDNLYTISDSKVIINSLADFSELKSISLDN